MYERLSSLAERLDKVRSETLTEEATKTALVLPFIRELGYDIFDPEEVIPEFTADVGIKKGEKVDYAICKDGSPIILFECKPYGSKLESYSSQLYRYFCTTKTRIAILTDGVRYLFYSDLVKLNILDDKPFLVLTLDRLTREQADRVAHFTKELFDLETVIADAEELYAKTLIREHIAQELKSPTDELVRYFADPVHKGPMRQNVIERFRPIVRASFQEHIAFAVESRLRSAISSVQGEQDTHSPSGAESLPPVSSDEPSVVTTEEELHGFYIVKAIIRDLVDPCRITPRDVHSYFGVLLDNNNRKPICRLHFNRKQKYLGVFDAQKLEQRIPIETVDDLFRYAAQIRESLGHVIDD